MNEKLFFKHYYFNIFKEGKRVYKWFERFDWPTGKTTMVRLEGVIVRKKSFSLTVQWKVDNRIENLLAAQAIDKLSLHYEPNDIFKEIL